MAIVPEAAVEQTADTQKSLHAFTVEQYVQIDVPGRTELVEGLIYDLSPMNPPHLTALDFLVETFVPNLVSSAYMARFESPIAVDGWTGNEAPYPDVAIIARKHYDQYPIATETRALIEISDTTYADDRTRKIPIYVRAGIASWIVNTQLRQVEFYGSVADLSLPHGHILSLTDSFEIVGVRIAVSGLFHNPAEGAPDPNS